MAIRNCWGRLTFFLQDHETFFGEALQKWKELNCTVDFSKQLFTDEEALLTFILCVIELCRLFSLLLKFLLFGIKTGEKHGETWQNWKVFFTSLSSVAFQQEVRNLAGSLPQLLHHKVLYIPLCHCYIMATSLLLRRWLILQDQVTASLKKYLLMKNSLSYEPLLE